jgi:4-diphosphocytidyl-2-C-methyl-D-erythritol kinase
VLDAEPTGLWAIPGGGFVICEPTGSPISMVDKKQVVTLDDGLVVRAPAKINLSLLVAGERLDGFHEVETVMAKVDFFDEIFVEPGRKPGIELVCKGPCRAPEGKQNLVYQACELLLESCASSADIKITLTKNVPAGTGLGSGSSDAAATLMGVNRLLQLSLQPEELAMPASRLGSDVAFFLDGPLGLCTGRGEKIKKLDRDFKFRALLILPDVSVSTKEVYANYRHDKVLYESLSGQINTYIQNNRIDLVSKMCANMLEKSCFNLYKELGRLKTKIESLGIGPLCLSGSGSAMFCVAGSSQDKLERQRRKVKRRIGCKSVIVSNNRW